MYLKSIEVQGFKSFANKTVFQFHNGITGIVGPNGSGKSNVGDAVRWVLGEQRVKQLRGGSMQDVIFAGTENRKPLGYASVAITLDNTDHVLPVSYEEVTVTRRLYRSGESEYLINGTNCRLKDINEMFYDTGIGKEGYSIIGQGQIDKILSGKPEERRELFDEAAGIVKFKKRKLETAKRLENEQQNLTRINDILSELSRQVGPLERQAEKAKIYLKKKEELKAYDVNLFLEELDEAKVQIAKLKENEAEADRELDEVKQETESIRNEYEASGVNLEQMDREQSELSDKIGELRLEISGNENSIALANEQIAAAKANEKTRETRVGILEDQKKGKEADLNSICEGLVNMAKSLAELRAKDDILRGRSEDLEKKENDLSEKLQQSRNTQVELLEEQARIRARQQHYETLLEQMGIRRAEFSSQILALKTEGISKAEQLAIALEQCKELDQEISVLQGESSALGAQLEEVQNLLSDENQRVQTEQEEYHKIASRLETLRNIAERYDGYGNSIRRVMERKDREKGLHGVVADLIRTQKKYETAIETALGGSIQNIVTEDEETAKRMIEYLKVNKYGRATFLPLTAMRRTDPFKQTSALNEPGVIGIASTLVQVDGKFSSLVQYLLGRTVVVDNIDHAVALARKFKYVLRIVTLEGESLSPGGSMTGGAFKNSSNLLGRKREIEELKKQVIDKKQLLEDLRGSIDVHRNRRNALRDEIRELGEKLQKLYLKKNTADLKRKEIENSRNETELSFRKLQEESEDNAAQIRQINADRDEELKILEETRRKESEAANLEASLLSSEQGIGREKTDVAGQLEALHVELASMEQKAAYLTREKERLESEIRTIQDELQDIAGQTSDAKGQIRQKEEAIASLQDTIREQKDRLQALQDQAREVQEKRDALTKNQTALFQKREDLTQRYALLDRESFRLKNQIEKAEENRENRISYMWDEYELTYSGAQALRRDDLGSKTEWKRQMGVLKKDIRDLGNVNVNAIEEYKEVHERYVFLSSQQEDVVKAETALRKLIEELESGMRKQFREQFGRIAAEFDKSFKQLFGGGKGTLELVEEEDILTAGIRIIAQPPGKKLQNMMQLSGGEKALTAIALLFAIQNLKPSPFCLLDEIEAALDESNVDRYASYLHKLTKHTQFIIITHRRGTMAAADRLYGITMQEKGVSALVSVNLIEDELDS